jgi:hypothetical protein
LLGKYLEENGSGIPVGIILERLRKTTNILSQGRQFIDPDSKCISFDFKPEALPLGRKDTDDAKF